MLPLNFRVVHGVLLGGGEDFFIQMAAPEQDIGAAAPQNDAAGAIEWQQGFMVRQCCQGLSQLRQGLSAASGMSIIGCCTPADDCARRLLWSAGMLIASDHLTPPCMIIGCKKEHC